MNDAEPADTGGSSSSAPSLQRRALEICAGVITGSEPGVADIPERETLITTRWVHQVLHEHIPGVPVHLLATYYGQPAPRVWRCGKLRFEGVGHAGSIGVVPAGWDGQWEIEAEASVSYVMLSNTRLQEVAEQWPTHGRRVELVPCVGQPDPVGALLLRALSRHAALPDRSTALAIEQTLDLLCMHVIRSHSSRAGSPVMPSGRGLLSWQVRRVTAYMHDNLDQDISLDALAAQVNLSRFHFSTAFKLATGQTPHECLVSLRIERARQLLMDARRSVTEIALAVGYRTPSAFAASFRKATGATPTEFRRSL